METLGWMVTLVSRQLLPMRMMLVALEGRSDASLVLGRPAGTLLPFLPVSVGLIEPAGL